MLNLLIQNHTLTLFVVLLLGFFIGNIRVFGFSLGAAGVLFAGLLVSALSPDIKLDPVVYELGLALFVYTIALASGGHFLHSLNREGLRRNVLVLAMLLLAAGLTLLAGRVLGLDAAQTAGLFTGAFTNTPALASVIQSVSGQAGAGDPVVTYSIAYPMGVIGVMLALFFLERHFKVDYAREARELHLSAEELVSQTVVIRDDHTQKLRELFRIHDWPVVFGRVAHAGQLDVADADYVPRAGDLVSIIGTPDDVRRVAAELGEPSTQSLAADRSRFDFRRIFVSNALVAGRSLAELNLHDRFGAIVTRVRRGDRDIVPSGSTVLELGDRVRVVSPHGRVGEITKFFGDSYKHLSEINLLTFSLGLVLGLLLGAVNIPLLGGSSFQLGVAGGSLLVGLLLGALGRTGRMIWTIPYSANLTLRQLGLALFLAGVGLRSGGRFAAQIGSVQGLMMFLAGTVLTCLVATLLLLLGYRVMRLPFSVATGVLSGFQTHPAVLAYASERSGNEAAEIGYASVYPVAMIGKILLAQVILALALK